MQQRTATRTTRSRSGYTLLELLIASATASILMAGSAGSIYIASQALNLDDGAAVEQANASIGINRVMDDLRHALAFTERTATAVTFTVPDRDGDDRPEKIRYAWSGVAGTALGVSINDSAPSIVVQDVQTLNFDYIERLVAGEFTDIETAVPVVYEGFSEAKTPYNETTLTINKPGGTEEGELLIVALAVDGNMTDQSMLTAPGWDWISLHTEANRVNLAVLSRVAGASEPSSYTFDWAWGDAVYGWIMRFSGQDPTNPIHAMATNGGTSASPVTPAISTTVDGCLILRLGAFDDDDVDESSPGLTGHTLITMDENADGNNTASGAAGYKMLDVAATAPSANFSLTASEEYATLTIAISPEVSP